MIRVSASSTPDSVVKEEFDNGDDYNKHILWLLFSCFHCWHFTGDLLTVFCDYFVFKCDHFLTVGDHSESSEPETGAAETDGTGVGQHCHPP